MASPSFLPTSPQPLTFPLSPHPCCHPAGSERTCCPVNWVDYEGSCYWFSRSGKAWAEAEKYCQLENAHLVVINSREEQVTPSSSPRREETSGPRTLGGWVRLVLLLLT